MLAEGHSTIDPERVDTQDDPPASIFLLTEERTARVRLKANTDYWNNQRGPFLEEVVFRNDLSLEKALELVCETEGEVDLVTEVPPEQAARVEKSKFAKLIAKDAVRILAGVINRYSERFPFTDKRARQAINLALDRKEIVAQALHGFGTPLTGLTPLSATEALPSKLKPYPYDSEKAARLWRQTTISNERLRLAAGAKWEQVARVVMQNLESALGLDCELIICNPEELMQARRRLAEKKLPNAWDVLLMEQGAQAADSVPAEMHRAFAGCTGEFRAGPIVPQFEEIYEKLIRQTSPAKQAKLAYRLDRFVYEEALALFVCAPYALYAVNKEVAFQPYRTTFELAECKVSAKHWSRR